MIDMGRRARNAARAMMLLTNEERSRALDAMAAQLVKEQDAILAANRQDMENGRQTGLTDALLDRLALSPARIQAMAEGLSAVAAMPDPLNKTLWAETRPNGLSIRRVSSPIGVLAVIFEARPNVTSDSAALALKAGSAVILRGGREAIHSNTAVVNALRSALQTTAAPEDAVQLVTDTDRSSADALMKMTGYIDLLIPRGGRGLIRHTVENASVPVLETGEGVCHTYVDRDADIAMAAAIVDNAKTSRPSVCNALECLLVHRDISARALPVIAAKLGEKHVEIRGDAETAALLPSVRPATEEDWGHEFLDYVLAVKVVGSMEEALAHIARYGSGHSECIVTDNADTARSFQRRVDAACVYHNASTRFTDGGEFGFGAEIGISTQKLHARGPVGLEQLTSYRYLIEGSGQIRG